MWLFIAYLSLPRQPRLRVSLSQVLLRKRITNQGQLGPAVRRLFRKRRTVDGGQPRRSGIRGCRLAAALERPGKIGLQYVIQGRPLVESGRVGIVLRHNFVGKLGGQFGLLVLPKELLARQLAAGRQVLICVGPARRHSWIAEALVSRMSEALKFRTNSRALDLPCLSVRF